MTVQGHHMSRDMAQRRNFGMNDTLKSGDFFAYMVEVDRDAYVYVLQFYADGTAKVLFPPSGHIRIAANQRRRVPTSNGQWFQLDEATGTEHLYVIASVESLQQAAPELAEVVGEVRVSPTKVTSAKETAKLTAKAKEPPSDHASARQQRRSRRHPRPLQCREVASCRRPTAIGRVSAACLFTSATRRGCVT